MWFRKSIDETINRDRLFAICSAGNDGRSAALFDVVADVVRIITTVRDEDLGTGQIGTGEDVISLVVGDVAASNLCPDWQAPGIGNQMNLGRDATY